MRMNFSGKRNLALPLFLAVALFSLIGCQPERPTRMTDLDDGRITSPIADEEGHIHDDGESIYDLMGGSACAKATAAQIAEVDKGNGLYKEFLKACVKSTGETAWCEELTRPNPDSAGIFTCTYGPDQVHRFIHPDRSTWPNAFEAVKIIVDLQAKHIGVKRIYNWWRPEPYNKNVDGAGGRHPFGTAVDVEFDSQRDKNLAFGELCKMRNAGRLKAIGYYEGLGLHFGIADRTPNTWGKTCSHI